MRLCPGRAIEFCELRLDGVLGSSAVEQGVKLLLQGSRLLFAPDGTPFGLGASAPLLGGALLLLRGRLLRNWLPRFLGSLGLNRDHLSTIRIDRLYFRLYGVLLPLGRQLEATILLLLDGVLLPEGPPLLLLVGTDDPAISVEASALAHATATDCGASPCAVSSSP